MTIETKYNIGDEVWFMYDNKATTMTIEYIEVTCAFKSNKHGDYVREIKVTYLDIAASHRLSEHKLFPTKEELLKSL